MSVAFSKDGIHWGKAIKCPDIRAAGDTHNNAFWAPTLKKYIGITRTWGNIKKGKPHCRQVAWTSGKDFLKWSKVKVILQGLKKHLQIYSMPVFYYGGVYIGLPAIYNTESDRTHTELAWSSDTINWNRVNPGIPLIANSIKKGNYDWGCVYAAAYPVIMEEKILLYYGGSDGNHNSWRNGFFCLASLRADGFAGYEQKQKHNSASIITTPFRFKGKKLCLNADILKKGLIKIKLLNKDGKELTQSRPIQKTAVNNEVEWLNKFNMNSQNNKMIQLKFDFKNAKIYSFSIL